MPGKLFYILISVLILKGKIAAQAVNIDFESSAAGSYTAGNSVSGWTLSNLTTTSCGSSAWNPGSSEFSLAITPISGFPVIGTIPNSPLGGYMVAVLNDQTANNSFTKLSRSLSVTGANTLLQFAFAGVWQNHGSVLCCQETGFDFLLKDQNGNLLSCSSLTLGGSSCQATGITYSVGGNGTYNWTNWQIKYIDLTPYLNTTITIEIISKDCTYGDHYGTLLCDLNLSSSALPPGWVCPYPGGSIVNPVEVNFCSGSGIAQINAPLGYVTYSWTPPSGIILMPSQATLSSISVTNPIVGDVYSVTMTQSNSQCVHTATYAIWPSTVSVLAIGAGSTCAMGSSGSATVIGNGSGIGYNYTWYNSTNSVVGTTSVVNNLTSGVYSVNITSAGSTSTTCGSDTRTINVGVRPPGVINDYRTYCSNTVFLTAPMAGANYQWYVNQAAISSSLGGTSSTFTLSTATSWSTVTLGVTLQGCRDSIRYFLFATQPGSLIALNNPIACTNGTNGSIVLSLTPSAGTPSGSNTFKVLNSNSITPTYSSVSNNGTSLTYTTNGLSAGGNYSVSAFDGACFYSLSFSVTPYAFSASLSAPSSNTICSNGMLNINAVLSPYIPGTYNFLWTPSLNFWAGINTQSTVLIMTPSLSPGTNTTITYSVVITPTLINCPQTKTINVTYANPITPSVLPIPNLCNSLNTYTISANPPGGIFSNNPAVSPNGIIMPAAAAWGLNTFTYANTIGACVAQTSGSFVVYNSSPLQVSGNTIICEGQSTTLLASGANTYTWNGNNSGPIYVANPMSNSSYTVTGMNNYSCPSTFVFTVAVTPLPTLSLFGDTTICKGESTILYASGADSYNWNGNVNSSTISVSPTVMTAYTVTGINNPGSCASTAVISVNVIDCVNTGIEELSSQNGIHVFPNPSSGILFIETNENKDIILSDLSGKIIYSHKLQAGTHSLDLSPLADGYYLLKVRNDKTINTYKILKND